jgi:hypothetical protein
VPVAEPEAPVDEPEAPVEESGFVKAHFAAIADLRIQKATESYVGYRDVPTARGFIFKPLRDIKMTSVGAMIAEKGTYGFFLAKSKEAGLHESEQVIDSLVVTDTLNFTYKKLQKPIILKADSIYTISYFALNHSAVYDAASPGISFPFTAAGIQMLYSYYAYYYIHPPSDKYVDGYRGWSEGPMMRGLVDFIYEEI